MSENFTVRLHLFGPPQAFVNDQQVHLARRKSLAMLIYLAVENKPISRESLGVMFWPDSADSQQQVRIALSDIRKQLGDHIFAEQRNPIRVDPNAVSVDVLQFHKFATSAVMSDMELLEIRKLIDLADDRFLSGFTLRDCPDFDAWLQLQEQIALRELQRCYYMVIRYLEQKAKVEEAITYTRQLVHLDPFNEEHYRLLLRFHAQNREPHLVEKVYQWLRQTLKDELGVEPDQKTQALYLHVQKELQAPESPDQKQPDEAAYWGEIAKIHTLPYYGQPYFGRVKEQETILKLLANPECRLISIVGMGGIGKTHLVSHMFTKLPRLFPDGVYYVPLDSITDANQMLSEITSRLQMVQAPGDILTPIIAYLRNRFALIILDNLEQLLPEGAFIIKELLLLTDQPKFLITSRIKLQLHQEYSISLEGLNYPSPDTPPLDTETLQYYNAVQMFLHWAKKKKYDFRLTSQNANAVRALCTQLEGLPLALRLAAAWVEIFSPTELVAEIHRNLAFVRDDLHDIPIRHRSFRALFQSVWEQITPEEREAFSKLCIFRSGFTWRAARAITGVSTRELKSLVDQSLLLPDPSRGSRYQIHEIFRFFGQRQQNIEELQRPLYQQYVHYYADYVQDQERDLKAGDQLDAITRMDLEYDNIQKAWALASHQGFLPLLEKMIPGLHLYIIFRNKWNDGKRLFEAALADISFGEDAVSHRVYGKLSSRFYQSTFQKLLKLGEILRSARNNQDWPEVVHVFMEIGYILRFLENYKIANMYFEYALQVCQENAYVYDLAQAQYEIADISIMLDDLARAQYFAQQSLENMERIENMHGSARVKLLLGEVLFFKGDLNLALEYMRFARDKIEKYTGADAALYMARILPWILFLRGDFEQSSRLANWLYEISQLDELVSLGDHLLATQLLGINAFVLGDLDTSQKLITKSFVFLENVDKLTTMRGKVRTDRHLFLLVKIAEALSYFIMGDNEQSKAIADDLLDDPTIHKRPFLITILLALDVLRLDTNKVIYNQELSNWLGKMDWAVQIRRQMKEISNQN